MKVCNGVKTQITHFRCLRISPLIFATVQNFALDNLRDQQILIPTCEWGWVVMFPLLNTTLEVEESPGMVCTASSKDGPCCQNWKVEKWPRHFCPPTVPNFFASKRGVKLCSEKKFLEICIFDLDIKIVSSFKTFPILQTFNYALLRINEVTWNDIE